MPWANFLKQTVSIRNTVCEGCRQLASWSDCNLSPSCQGAFTCLVSIFSFQSSMTSKQANEGHQLQSQRLLWVNKDIEIWAHRTSELPTDLRKVMSLFASTNCQL